MNCKGYLEIEFASYLVVSNVINVIKYNNPSEIPVSIAVNTEDLSAHLRVEEYVLPQPLPVPNPCDPTDPAKSIIVNEVTVNVIRATGGIGYYVGAKVLESDPNVIVEPPSTIQQYATVGGYVAVPFEILIVVDDPTVPVPELQVTVQDLEVTTMEVNEVNDVSYLITGKFRIDPINESGII